MVSPVSRCVTAVTQRRHSVPKICANLNTSATPLALCLAALCFCSLKSYQMVHFGIIGACIAGAGILGMGLRRMVRNRAVVGAATRFVDGGFNDQMTPAEAADILGVKPTEDPKEIKKAHRLLIVRNHPDAGGSPFLSAKINEAKDLLVGKKKLGRRDEEKEYDL